MLLRAVGGWAGLPQGEDLSMVAAVTGSSHGVVVDADVYRYRDHPGQMTAAADFDTFEQVARQSVFDRAQALTLTRSGAPA